jgi:hypothetical protein
MDFQLSLTPYGWWEAGHEDLIAWHKARQLVMAVDQATGKGAPCQGLR